MLLLAKLTNWASILTMFRRSLCMLPQMALMSSVSSSHMECCNIQRSTESKNLPFGQNRK